MQVFTRSPGKKFKDRTGEVTPHGLKIIRFLGFGITESGKKTSFSVYDVECPHCGSTSQMWGNGLSRNKSCGCKTNKQPQIYHAMKRKWNSLSKSRSLCDHWQVWENFQSDLSDAWFDGAKIFAKDVSLPISPGNYILMHSDICGLNSRAFGFKVTIGSRVFTFSESARVLGVSRQAVHQMSKESLIHQLTEKIRLSSTD
jgi:transposase-like protein